jgi:predicted O-methyltransferase YrrM
MKAIFVLFICTALMYAIYNFRVEKVHSFAEKQIHRAEVKESEARKRNYEILEKAKAEEKVKVFVKAKDARTCMKELNKDVIDNSVIECNKDHYIELTRGEVKEMEEKL